MCFIAAVFMYVCHLMWMSVSEREKEREEYMLLYLLYGYDDDNGQWHTSQFIFGGINSIWWWQIP